MKIFVYVTKIYEKMVKIKNNGTLLLLHVYKMRESIIIFETETSEFLHHLFFFVYCAITQSISF